MLTVFGTLKGFFGHGVRLVVRLVVRGIFGGNITGHSLVKVFRAFRCFFICACNVRLVDGRGGAGIIGHRLSFGRGGAGIIGHRLSFGRGGAGIIGHRLAFGLRMFGACGFVVHLRASGLVIVSCHHLSHGLPALAAIDGGPVLRGIAVSGTDVGSPFLHVSIPDGVILELCGAIEFFPDGHALLHPIPDSIHHPIGVRPV